MREIKQDAPSRACPRTNGFILPQDGFQLKQGGVMFDHLLTEEQRRVRDAARDFVNSTPRQLILDMDEDKVRFPKEWLREAGRRNLLGVRHPVKWGGQGLDWVTS